MLAYKVVFWVSLFFVVYTYIGYPMVLYIINFFKQKTITKDINLTPPVSILIAAYNEEEHIKETIINKLEQNYPQEKLEIIVISDESTDKTDDIVNGLIEEYPNQIRLLRQIPRNGKTAGLNMAIPHASGDIIVFSDANSIYDINALKNLVANFSANDVGYVTGKMIYVKDDGSVFGDGCSSYMKYENILRHMETNIGSVVGVDGGIDAARKELYIAMRPDQIPDFVFPLNVISQGYRVIYESSAILKEHLLDNDKDEYRMRVRVGLRSLWAIWDNTHLLNPLKYGLFSWQLFSHKIIRYLAFIPLFTMLIANMLLLTENIIYDITFVGQLVFYALAYVGGNTKLKYKSILTTIPYYFVLINIATAYAFFKFLKGDKQKIWNPRVG